MPTAYGGAAKKYAWKDHDTDIVNMLPPVLNQWYTVFDAEDVRLLEMYIAQVNTETDPKDVEVRWTIDGNVYFVTVTVANGVENYIYRTMDPSTAGTSGLTDTIVENPAFIHNDKRGLDFKVEVRIISALGTAQRLVAYAVRETLEET
jgi:hypothetical protein